jgi:CrcB protein
MDHVLLVAAGGALGATLRHFSGQAAMRLLGSSFPYGTMFVNIVGSFAMGLFITWLAHRASGASAGLRLFVATGFMGGFTTFSSFSLDFAVLYERGEISAAFAYATLSVLVAIIALFAGMWLARVVA